MGRRSRHFLKVDFTSINKAGTVHIGAAADGNYAMPLAVMLNTAAHSLAQEYALHVHVIDNGMSSEARLRVESALHSGRADAVLDWLKPSTFRLNNLAVYQHLTVTAYCRIMLADLLPMVRRVIYLDCDLIVRKDISDLWVVGEQSNAPLCAVQGYGAPYAGSRFGIPHHQVYGISADAPCFNSGVMLLNLERWRSEGLAEQVWKFASRVVDSPEALADQFALNLAFHDSWNKLDPRWNQMHPIYKFEQWPESPFRNEIEQLMPEILNDPWIVHFTSGRKPWQRGSRHPFTREFLSALRASGWFSSPLAYWLWSWLGRKGLP